MGLSTPLESTGETSDPSRTSGLSSQLLPDLQKVLLTLSNPSRTSGWAS